MAPMETDETVDDGDSGLGDDGFSTQTQTIASSIYNYRVENGRTYHAFPNGCYLAPNDEQAIEHLDLAHHLFTLTLSGKLHLAPVPEDAREVLDLGTGTGVWAIDWADAHPLCSIIGTDLSPIQPNWVPPNCMFEIDDYNDDWTFGANRFDFIHLRNSQSSVRDRAKLYEQCLFSLKPGGFLEEVEFSPEFASEDNSILPGTPMARWNALSEHCASRFPAEELYIFRHMKAQISAAGFEDVYEKCYRWPIGTWPKDKTMKELGAWARIHIDLGLENWVLMLLSSFGWTVEEIKGMCDDVRKQMRIPSVHAIHHMNIVYGRKPMI